MARAIALVGLALLGLLLPGSLAFKENEFKKCAQTSFCSRNRNVQQGANFEIVPASVTLNTATLTATLLNKQASKHLQLTLTAHADGFVRLLIDESPSVGRYQVPSDILVSGWETRKAAIKEQSRSANGIVLTTGDTKLELGYAPFTLAVSVKGVPALQLNSRNLFNFEHRRPKQVRAGEAHAERDMGM
jgi:alpha 1,3-glucosidase